MRSTCPVSHFSLLPLIWARDALHVCSLANRLCGDCPQMEMDAWLGCSDPRMDPRDFAVTYDRPNPAELLARNATRSRHVR